MIGMGAHTESYFSSEIYVFWQLVTFWNYFSKSSANWEMSIFTIYIHSYTQNCSAEIFSKSCLASFAQFIWVLSMMWIFQPLEPMGERKKGQWWFQSIEDKWRQEEKKWRLLTSNQRYLPPNIHTPSFMWPKCPSPRVRIHRGRLWWT